MRNGLVIILAVLLVGFGLGFAAASSGTVVTGVVAASEHEAQEGYFALGQDAMVFARPGAALHDWLQSHIGQRVRVTLDVDPGSE